MEMMKNIMLKMKNHVEYILRQDMSDMEVLKASYTTQTFSRHWHENFGIGIIENGVEAFDYNKEKCYAPKSSIVLMNPGIIHTGQAVNQEKGWRYWIMYPSPILLQEIMEQINKRHSSMPYFPKAVVSDTYCEKSLYRMFQLLLDRSSSLLECQTSFFTTMIKVLQHHAKFYYEEKKINWNYKVADDIREYIDNNYNKNVSLDELSIFSNMSKFNLLRVFEKRWGVPPHIYQIVVRIQKSKELLIKGYPIVSTALKMGFADQSHFTRHFKRVVGITPYKYQTQLINSNIT